MRHILNMNVYMNHHVTRMNTYVWIHAIEISHEGMFHVTNYISPYIYVCMYICESTSVYLLSLYKYTGMGKYNAYSSTWVWVQQNKETEMNSYPGIYSPVILCARIWVIWYMCMMHCHMEEKVLPHTCTRS